MLSYTVCQASVISNGMKRSLVLAAVFASYSRIEVSSQCLVVEFIALTKMLAGICRIFIALTGTSHPSYEFLC